MSQLQSLYTDHFGMTGRPFCGMANSELVYWDQDFTRAQAALEYGILSGGAFVALTGAAGSGKTSVLLNFLENITLDLKVGMVHGLRRNAGTILPWILQSLGHVVDGTETETALLTLVQDQLIAEYAAGRRTVLVFDDAQNLTVEMLDELRLLTNINTSQDQLVQIILCGEDSLRERLRQPELAGLAQRVAAWARLKNLSREAVERYVEARLIAADGCADLYTEEALDLVHDVTRGIPRAINQICELALVYAMTGGGEKIGTSAIEQILDDGLFIAPADPPDIPTNRTGRLRLAVG